MNKKFVYQVATNNNKKVIQCNNQTLNPDPVPLKWYSYNLFYNAIYWYSLIFSNSSIVIFK
jgi:hypothetical protein